MKCEYNTGPIYGSEKSSKKASLAPLIGTGGTGNVLRLGPGITAADLKLALGSLAIQVGDDARDTLHFDTFDANAVLARKPFDRVQFDDGSTLTYEALPARGFDLIGTAGDDTMAGTNVNDRINGGAGNDTLSGGAGDDRYSFALGDGQDQVIDVSGTDTIAFGPGLDFADMKVAQRLDVNRHWRRGERGLRVANDKAWRRAA